MNYVDEFRQPHLVRQVADALHQITTRPWTIMEVFGGQTHSIVKSGISALIPDNIHLIHAPGCPVCVTPVAMVDHALHIATQLGTILCSFGDMLRVPGTNADLLTAKAKGADVRIIHSPLEALKIAEGNPQKQVVFFAVGFETTAPANALTVFQAKRYGIKNFSLLVSHALVPPALRFLLKSPDNRAQGFLAAGHVCTVTGYHQYHCIAREYRVPIVITGFEPLDILQGLYFCVQQLERGEYAVQNQYQQGVCEKGNIYAQSAVSAVFKEADREGRGLGTIPKSGLELQAGYADFDATLKFPVNLKKEERANGCISGLILQEKNKPCECPLFGSYCTPERPFGVPMVSNEGACAEYYHHSR